MSHRKAYAIAAISAALVLAPTAAHADKVWWDALGGIDCDRETYFDTMPNGEIHHMPALGYEIESYCGHAPTVDWGDTAGTVYVEGSTAPAVSAPVSNARPAQPAPVKQAPAQPAVAAPVEVEAPLTAPPRDRGHSIFTLAV